MDLLTQDPLGLVSLANTGREHTHIVALSDHPVFEVGARFGRARLTFMQKPVESPSATAAVSASILIMRRSPAGRPVRGSRIWPIRPA